MYINIACRIAFVWMFAISTKLLIYSFFSCSGWIHAIVWRIVFCFVFEWYLWFEGGDLNGLLHIVQFFNFTQVSTQLKATDQHFKIVRRNLSSVFCWDTFCYLWFSILSRLLFTALLPQAPKGSTLIWKKCMMCTNIWCKKNGMKLLFTCI